MEVVQVTSASTKLTIAICSYIALEYVQNGDSVFWDAIDNGVRPYSDDSNLPFLGMALNSGYGSEEIKVAAEITRIEQLIKKEDTNG